MVPTHLCGACLVVNGANHRISRHHLAGVSGKAKAQVTLRQGVAGAAVQHDALEASSCSGHFHRGEPSALDDGRHAYALPLQALQCSALLSTRLLQ